MSSTLSGTTIRYTSDGSTPTSSSTAYSSSITVDQSMTLKAIATKSGWTDSAVATNVYNMKVATPGFSPVGGSYSSAQSVSVSSVTPSTTFRYTTDRTQPTRSSPVL